MKIEKTYGIDRRENCPSESREKFWTKKGELTDYALACGYVQAAHIYESPERGSVNLSLWSEHNCFHVRAHDHHESKRLFWESFDAISKARKFFHESLKQLERGV